MFFLETNFSLFGQDFGVVGPHFFAPNWVKELALKPKEEWGRGVSRAHFPSFIEKFVDLRGTSADGPG